MKHLPVWLPPCLALAVVALLSANRSGAYDDNSSVVRVEEDWRLVVNEVNSDTASPQVSTQMARAPYAARFCNFHLNSRDVPSFQEGGLQLQVWLGNDNLAAVNSASTSVMSTSNEEITWTQYLRRINGRIRFGIAAAASTTWGDFSGAEAIIPSGSTSLDDYDPDYSARNSGITYGANRVTVLELLRVRVYYSNGGQTEDLTRRQVYPEPAE